MTEETEESESHRLLAGLKVDGQTYFDRVEKVLADLEISEAPYPWRTSPDDWNERDKYWSKLPREGQDEAKRLVERLVSLGRQVAPAAQRAPLSSEADQRELLTGIKAMRAALLLRRFRSWDTEILNDQDIVLGVKPAGQSDERFSKTDGEAVVAELVERAKAINARDDLLCGISELRLYGSMLDPKAETVGDVDVAYELFYKQPPPGKRRSEWHIERAKQSGRNFQFREMLSYGTTEVERLLKARKSRLSLLEMFHFEHLQPMPKFHVILKADRESERQNKGTIREG